ncbi:MAG TPA: S8 family serine peptidase [Baekduia sp.]|uniref:S8 family serine peptidase n=1 Tax=Baekduia sp. TaxID=2600305 RepID=UPI002CB0A2FE|nr:S8 family serine peptidase [Baekduia sp.]HMJ36239.1 S8 family serine peptidase [Baekduia sp.]
MRRTRPWTLALAGIATGVAFAAGQPAAASAAPGDDDVLVVLERQAVMPAAPGGRRGRRVAVERALRDHADAEQRSILALLARRRAQGLVTSVRPFWIFNGLHVVARPSVIAELAARTDVAAIRSNATVQAPYAEAGGPVPEWNVARVNAPALWSMGQRGQGVVVAGMDTGVDATHQDLSSRWRGGANSWYDPSGEHPTVPTDRSGHGTWTMGAMVGGSAGGTAIGVAPDARWIAVKLFNDRGTTTTARIHAGFQWLLDPDGNPATADAPDVVNNSWTLSSPGCNLEFQPDLRSLRAAGILPVFAAGNAGPASATSLSPANNPEALAVGGTDADDVIDPGSSRGPSSCGQGTYPSITAPGVGVRTTDLFGLYATESGTSMAAPHAAGALALLLGAFPDADADRQEGALRNGAADLGITGPDDLYGSGRLDVLAAYGWLSAAPDFTLTATPASATVPAGGTATYAVDVGAINGLSSDVALSVGGLPAAQGTASIAPGTIAGGSGSATLTVTTAASAVPGTYALTVRAAAGATVHTASVALVVPAPPDFTLSATPATATVLAGQGTSYTVAVGSQGGFAADVALSLSGLSATEGTATFTPATVAGGAGTSQLTVTAAGSLAAGSHPLTITGQSGSITHTATVTLVVAAAPDFALAVSPSSRTVVAGQSTTYQVGVSSAGGFAGTVGLSLSGLPAAATASFSPVSLTAPGTATLTVRTQRQTTRGTFTLRVTGRSGTLTRQATASLVVRP